MTSTRHDAVRDTGGRSFLGPAVEMVRRGQNPLGPSFFAASSSGSPCKPTEILRPHDLLVGTASRTPDPSSH